MNDPLVVKVYLTFFNLYRIIEFPGQLDLKSITDPFKGSDYSRLKQFLIPFKKLFLKVAGNDINRLANRELGIYPIFTSSPQSDFQCSEPSSSVSVLLRSYQAIRLPDNSAI